MLTRSSSPPAIMVALGALLAAVSGCEAEPIASPSPSVVASVDDEAPGQTPAASPSRASDTLDPTSGGEESDDSDEGKEASTDEPADGDLLVVDRDGLADGGDLRLAVSQWPGTWNPWAEPVGDDAALVLGPMAMSFFTVDAAGEWVWNPDYLAAEPEVLVAEPTIVRYRFNPLAVWGDGAALGLVDFQATLDACRLHATEVCLERGFDRIAEIGPGETAHDVVVTYTGAYPEWRRSFATGPARAESVAGDAFATRWGSAPSQPGWFAGPYQVTAVTERAVVLTRNPYWWGDRGKLDSITVSLVPQANLRLAFEQGAIDAAALTDPNAAADVEALTTLEIRRSGDGRARYLTLDTTRAPLDDPRVRQALLVGIDGVAVAAAALPGFDWTAEPFTTLLGDPQRPGASDLAEATGIGDHDPQAAADLLTEAGWRIGVDGFRRRDGEVLTVSLTVPAADPWAEAEAYQLRVQLAELGIVCTLVETDPAVTAVDVAASRDYTLVALTRDILVNPLRLLDQFHSASPTNITGVSDPAIDAAIGLAAASVDPTAEDRSVNAALELIWRQAAVIPLYELPHIVAMTPQLANFGPVRCGTIRWQDVGFTR
ncbi:MAG: ABC transporter substrate-binding protein [Propionibacteriaceae bacterium]|jgi:peptide/nickel transport system substrate-binding protein|nr:ABC transporter substrate-binding protein [Propionibacteriaceae bacterium]